MVIEPEEFFLKRFYNFSPFCGTYACILESYFKESPG